MANVEIPDWLKNLPLAPEFRPTYTEFADPIAYISQIEKEASAFGICKVIPPLPKPSKRYVVTNLNRSLLRSTSCEFGSLTNEGKAVDLVDSEAKAVFTTRQQELGVATTTTTTTTTTAKTKRNRDIGFIPPAQKQVWQSGQVYTLQQFEAKSKAFSRSLLAGIREVTPQLIEALFWKANSDKPIYVEYANDVPGSAFGEPDTLVNYFHGRKTKRKRRRTQYEQSHLRRPSSSSCGLEEALGQGSYSFFELADQPTSSSNETSLSSKHNVSHGAAELEGTAGWKLSNSPWNLQVIARSAGSLTRFLLDDIPGVTSPMVYIGMLFSWFAWHVEDHELHSLNFLHMGSPKTWYAIPGDHASAFEEIIRSEAYGKNTDHLDALKRIGEKTTLLSPELVVSSGIPCCRLVQNPGEFVVTFPRAYHVGFSHGFNCGEAANFGTPRWLTVAKDAAVRRAAMDHLPMLSHQQLLYLLTMSFIPRIPRSLLPSIRSSRLKDRLKEERELLVKRAFIKDVLKENRLLNILSEKYPSFRAVLWHPDLLPAVVKESLPETETTLHSVLDKDNEVSVTAIKDLNHDGLVRQLTTSYVETLNDSCNNDLSCDFQVDSGALPCVTCGILGYPLMSVIQPSMKAAADLFPAEHLLLTEEAESSKKAKSSHHLHLTEQAISVTNVDKTWHTHGLMRPRIFCLEHAVQVKELLRPKGGAKMLVVCHSDYEKIRVNAATVAEEIRSEFNYKEVLLDSASKEELNLIDAAIDGEQFADCHGDWTSKLGMNLRYSIKVRTGCHSKKIGDLNSDYLLSLIAPGSMLSNIKWCSRKSRTRRESNNRRHTKICGDNHLRKDRSICESGSNLKRREKVLLHYSRRKHRARSKDLGAKSASTDGDDCSLEVANANCGKIDACGQKISCSTFARVTCSDSTELHTLDSTEHNIMQHCTDEIIGGGALGKACTKLEVHDHETSKRLEVVLCVNERQKHDISPGIEGAMPTFQKENQSDSCQTSPPAVRSFLVNNKQVMDSTIEDVELSLLKTKKRVKEIVQGEVYNEFVRSPCEGLRPRKRKEGINTLTEQKLGASKMTRKSLRSSISDMEGPYKCNVEGCHMCFRTKAQLLLHKRNKCHYEACRKRFRSHRYLMLHQRVHDDKRPLKCTWKGCGTTFKWAWARTEHLRLHTGERPYQCNTHGCGRTFRFVSDFSRHRRKLGH